MKLLLFEIMLLSNLIMLFVIQSYETLLVILRNFVDNISISYLFLKLLTQKFFDRGLHFSATNVKMFLKIVEFIASMVSLDFFEKYSKLRTRLLLALYTFKEVDNLLIYQ